VRGRTGSGSGRVVASATLDRIYISVRGAILLANRVGAVVGTRKMKEDDDGGATGARTDYIPSV